MKAVGRGKTGRDGQPACCLVQPFFGLCLYTSNSRVWTILPFKICLQCLEILLFVTALRGHVTGIQWVETRDAAKHPTVNSTGLTTKN